MKEEEKLFLLSELTQIEELIQVRNEIVSVPFVEIFEMHKKNYTAVKIAKKLKMERDTVHSIIHGAITIPKSKIKEIKKLGYKICCCCHKRIVPTEPLDYVILTQLCKICYKMKAWEDPYNISPDVKIY